MANYNLNRETSFRGLAHCEVIKGEVLIEGKRQKKSERFDIYSPLSHHAVTIKPLSPEVVLHFTRLEIPDTIHIPDLYPKSQSEQIVENFYIVPEIGIQLPHQFSVFADKITKNLGSKVATIGGKGSGKSTTNRYLVNNLLEKYEKVYWFEMDPGQPEFNVSGFLSLVEVTKPRYGPNYCFLRSEDHFNIISSYFLGSNNVGECKKTYLQIIKNMYRDLRKLDLNIPVIFNAMGWLRELGLHLLVESFKIVEIDFVLYLKTNTANDLPVDLEPELLLHPSRITGNNDDYRGKAEILADVSRKDVVRRKRRESGLTRELQPRQLRDIAYSLYFNEWRRSSDCMNIPLSQIKISVHDYFPPSIYEVLRKSIVALGVTNRSTRKSSEGFNILIENEFKALGWGWIEEIDLHNERIYLKSSLSIDELVQFGINCITLGNLPLPNSFIDQYKLRNGIHQDYVDDVTDPSQNTMSNVFKDITFKKAKRND